jgi:hypothetical protein
MVIMKKKKFIELLNRLSFLEEEVSKMKETITTTNTTNHANLMRKEEKKKETIINEWLYGKEQRNGK